MEYIKELKDQINIDQDFTQFINLKTRNYKDKYKSVDNLIQQQKINEKTLKYIIQECQKYNLSQNQIAVILAQGFAESGLKPNITNKYGFHGIWQFSKRQVSNFKLCNSLEKQVQYLLEEVGLKSDSKDYTKDWITYHPLGNGWIAKHKKIWDTSDNLYALNNSFSYGWERFAKEGKHMSENLDRFGLAQMFKEYLESNNIN